jgi:hypothetical protein
LLRDLRKQIFEALESNRADTSADTADLLAEAAPRNDDIALLHLKIIREKRPGKSEISIALEFTNGAPTRAASLLRGVRRYRQRLSQRDV